MTGSSPTDKPGTPENLDPESCSAKDSEHSIPEEYMRKIEQCEKSIGYTFEDKVLLCQALTHASGAHHRLASNERLEFFGDAILGVAVCESLFHRYPNHLEGDLTKIKSVLVSRLTCARISDKLGLEECLILGKGMASVASMPMSLLADVFEALVAAIYLDGGRSSVAAFINEHMEEELRRLNSGEGGSENYKSILQQLAQRDAGSTPSYLMLDQLGPDHHKSFKMAAQVGGVRYKSAWGKNKKEAEQRAACNALSQIAGDPPPFSSDNSPEGYFEDHTNGRGKNNQADQDDALLQTDEE